MEKGSSSTPKKLWIFIKEDYNCQTSEQFSKRHVEVLKISQQCHLNQPSLWNQL